MHDHREDRNYTCMYYDFNFFLWLGPILLTPFRLGWLPQGGGGGTASLRVGTQNKTTQTPGSVLPQPSLTALAGLQPPVFKVSKDSLLLLLFLPRLAPSGHDFQFS